jgi:hypothetical protein
MTTYGDSEDSLKQSLREMAVAAWNNTLGQGVDCSGKLAEYIQTDTRFQQYNAETLARETMDQVRKGNSRNIDLGANLRGGPDRYVPHR